MELEEVKFICPECGEQWVELQDPEDYWFKLGLRQTLCKNCADKIIKRLKEQWGK